VHFSGAHFREALNTAEKFKGVAGHAADHRDSLIGDRLAGLTLHFLGEQAEARRHLENMIFRLGDSFATTHIIRFGYDQRSTANNTLAEILWLQGLPDQAMRIVRENVDYIKSIQHELSLCNALNGACPVAILTGDLALAQQWVAMLLDHSLKHSLPLWHATGRCFDGLLRIKQGSIIGGINMLRGGLDELTGTRFAVRRLVFLGELAAACAQVGDTANAHAAIDDALDRCRRTEELWYQPELLRIKGEILLREGVGSVEVAETNLLRSLDLASEQKTLSWELRSTTSLAQLRLSQSRLAEAHQILSSAYSKFTEGFGTVDLQRAKQLLGEIGHSIRVHNGRQSP
jgi:predicted ATPase